MFLTSRARQLRLQAEYNALVNHDAVKRIIEIQKSLVTLQGELDAKLRVTGWSLTDDLEFVPIKPEPPNTATRPPPAAAANAKTEVGRKTP